MNNYNHEKGITVDLLNIAADGVEMSYQLPGTVDANQVEVVVTDDKLQNEVKTTVTESTKEGSAFSSSPKKSQSPSQQTPNSKEQKDPKPNTTPIANEATMNQILVTSFLIMPMPGYPFLRYETAASLERNHYVSLERYAIFEGNDESYNKCPKPIFFIIKNNDREYKETDGGAVKSFFPCCRTIIPPVKPAEPPSWIMLEPNKGEEFAKVYRIAEDSRHYKIEFPNKVQLIMDRPNMLCCGDTRCLPLSFFYNPAIDEHVELSSQDDKKIVKSNEPVLYGGSVIKNGEEEVFSNILAADKGFHIYPLIFGCNCLGCCNRDIMSWTPNLWRLKMNCIPKLCCDSQPLYEMETIKVLHGKSGRPDVIISFKNETKSSPFNPQFNANITRISFNNNSLTVEEKLACIMTEIIPHKDDEFDMGLI